MHFSVIEMIDKSIVFIHIIAGSLALISGFIPLVTRKGGATHRRWGQLYFWSMLVVFITAQTIHIFFRFVPLIFFAANMTFFQAYTGYRVLEYKSSKGGRQRWFLNWSMALGAMLSGIAWIWWSSSPLWSPELAVRIRGPRLMSGSIMGIWLGLYTCYWAVVDMVRFLKKDKHKQWWRFHHLSAMVNSYGSLLVAFTGVNSYRFIPTEYAWLLWVILGFGFGIGAFVWNQYYRRKFNHKASIAPALP